ncbi:hypothetical protein HJC23_009449 [Cyclotella cryptica]|uniref:ubiquitinyl hydrolase 1 n=1 Tax=Cyclotella cryptica TaxID=29204 RepID=A0ABD3Q2S3_9STRA|eukprot:CCRYP_009549-RA/>CCRYP_009549-RA protein AED:0.18 eAED:0.23 QI:0/-1/0/1/-1/1/1/0/326
MTHPESSSSIAHESQYKLTERQLSDIEAEIKSTQPLTSQPLPIVALIQQYVADPSTPAQTQQQDSQEWLESGFLASSKLLSKKYTHLRRIRGDGNCYYRAFLYSLCEGLLKRRFHVPTDDPTDDRELKRIRTFVTNSLSWVCGLGYEETTIEMFYDELVDLLDFIDNLPTCPSSPATDSNQATRPLELQKALDALHHKLNEENSTSDYCTWYLRVLTAAQMKSDPDRYLPFLLADDSSSIMDIPTFCSREVEPMNRECGMVQVAALAECFGVRVVIEYMDGSVVREKEEDGSFTFKVACHEFGETKGEDRMSVSLLYRPGHYDILY